MRDVCWRCRRPRPVCYCALLPSLPTRTRVVLLQHPRERKVGIGTALMTHLALPNSELHEGVVFEEDARIAALASDPTTAVLYPGGDAPAAGGAPVRSLIVVDGTWWQARKMLALNPRLAAVRRIGVTPRAPGNYRIRKEPRPECLATVEAVASALGALEGEPARFDEMLRAFTFMVDRQIEHQARSKAPRRRRAQAASPLAPLRPYLAEPERLVLVDGGASSGGPAGAGAGEPTSELVHLVACRASGERFEAFLRPRRPLGPSVAHQLEVPEARLLDGEDAGAALTRFRAFVGDGVLGTWGSFTVDVLAQEGVRRPPFLDLRDLCARHLGRRPGGIANGARALRAGEPAPWGAGRCGRAVGWLEVVLARLLDLAGEDSAPDS
ncbi:tRNA-uridine aminocarboxypropyltransferase [Sorangium atrum]|uniref:tRNA-uridine aminocarboxypropyltransferase n=1 Tax=Sorangium atrum TaxID=2995308 RepID=A0ABT5CGC4_9BACT|nr:tRNA-uridine aminocarboxypropyltransferase [Sorangium aterium]MDC0685475.1 DTW domain-containing protein [Sorangium aterium]